MTPAGWINRLAVLGLLALHLAWNAAGVWGPPSRLALAALALPVAVVAAMQFAARPSARFWSGVLALLTFCHGVTEAWADPAARVPALLETALSLLVIAGASWDGIVARFGRRRGPPPTV
jgi:uncharacterized membrane protein